jgi:hypothetical protein
MEVNKIITAEAVYWSWGCGGHKLGITNSPEHVDPNPSCHAYVWIPHFVTTKNASLKHQTGPYIGWKQMHLSHHSRIAVFLREFKDNKIVITKDDQTRMVESAIHMGYDWPTMVLSEIVLHDKDMIPIRHITDILYPLLQYETIEIVFDTNQVELPA